MANIAIEFVNTMAPQFLNHGLSAVDVLNKSVGIWSPATRIRRSPYVTHWSTADNTVLQVSDVGDAMGNKSDYSKKTIKIILKFGWKIPNFNSSAKILKRVDHLWI